MPRARDFLERLRPAGVPGAAGPAGVPADRGTEIAAELEPVFTALSTVEDEVRRLRGSAAAEAERRQRRAADTAADILGQARADAQATRAAVAAELRHQADLAAAGAQAAAEREAKQIAVRAARRLPALVASVIRRVRTDLAAATGTGTAIDSGGDA